MLSSFSDIDECMNNIDGCAQLCTNTIGSYVCSCRTGFVLASDRHACESAQEGQKLKDCMSFYIRSSCLKSFSSFQILMSV